MSAETILFAALTASAPLTALIGQRAYLGSIPEGAAFPAVVYGRTGTDRIVGIGGRVFGEWADLSVQCWATTQTAADQVADAVVLVIDALEQEVVDRTHAADLENGMFGTVLTVRMLV